MGRKVLKRIETFLIENGWVLEYKVDQAKDEYKTYYKDNNYAIDISTKEIVLIAEEGDFLHIPINGSSFYALFGALFYFNAISIDYKK